jgi:hypothetical protein
MILSHPKSAHHQDRLVLVCGHWLKLITKDHFLFHLQSKTDPRCQSTLLAIGALLSCYFSSRRIFSNHLWSLRRYLVIWRQPYLFGLSEVVIAPAFANYVQLVQALQFLI